MALLVDVGLLFQKRVSELDHIQVYIELKFFSTYQLFPQLAQQIRQCYDKILFDCVVEFPRVHFFKRILIFSNNYWIVVAFPNILNSHSQISRPGTTNYRHICLVRESNSRYAAQSIAQPGTSSTVPTNSLSTTCRFTLPGLTVIMITSVYIITSL